MPGADTGGPRSPPATRSRRVVTVTVTGAPAVTFTVTVAAGRITVGFGAAAGAAGDVDEFSHAILK
jgi:hypothetical protein